MNVSNMSEEELNSSLIASVESNDLSQVISFLEQGADPNAAAFSVHSKQILKALIKYGLFLHSGLIEIFLEREQMDLVKVLIVNDVYIMDLSEEVLQYLYSYFIEDKVVCAFLLKSCDPKKLSKFIFFYGEFSIKAATKVKGLIDFNCIYRGDNPLTFHARNIKTPASTIMFLLENGSNPNHLYSDKTNVLAYMNDLPQLLGLLVEYNIDVNNVDIHGNTPLFYSVSQRMTRDLIHKYNANIHHRNNNGEDFLFMTDNISKEDLLYCIDKGLKFDPRWCMHFRSKYFLSMINTTEYSYHTRFITNATSAYTDINSSMCTSIVEKYRPVCKYKSIKEIVEKEGSRFVNYYLTRYPSILDNTFKSASDIRYFYSMIDTLGLTETTLKRSITLSYHTDDLRILFHLFCKTFDPFFYVDAELDLGLETYCRFPTSIYTLIQEDAKKLFKTESNILKYIDYNGGSIDLLRYFNITPDCGLCFSRINKRDKVAYAPCCNRSSIIHAKCYDPQLTICIICRRKTGYLIDSNGFIERCQ